MTVSYTHLDVYKRQFQLYVSHESDEHLYFEFSRLILGEDADLGHIARQTMGDTNANLTDLQARVKPGPGLRLPYRDVSVGYPPVGVLAVSYTHLDVYKRQGAGGQINFAILSIHQGR